jgi:hypothetical protein
MLNFWFIICTQKINVVEVYKNEQFLPSLPSTGSLDLQNTIEMQNFMDEHNRQQLRQSDNNSSDDPISKPN